MIEKPCILIVDDNSENIRLLGTLLSLQNYRVVAAQNGQQALKALETIDPDLILLDIMMPVMDGFETCKRIKADPKNEDLSVIFLTAKTESKDILRGFELGAVDYITKPFDIPVLLARVKTHVKLHQYYRKLQNQAFLDGLTQVPNRLRFDQVLQNEWLRSLRTQSPLSLIMLDIDFFKQVNDNYGHLVGDEVLKKIAFTIDNQIKRAGDFIARYGGEEFIVVLPHTTLQNAVLLAETIRKEVEALMIPNETTELKYITISLGVASIIPSLSNTSKELMDMADQQLYLAKQRGRNQVQPELAEVMKNNRFTIKCKDE
jgi:diguanylate cyclase (GGDEF)-like protein